MPLNLWTLCNSITQALELLETDSEHGDVTTGGKASEDLEKNESEIEPIYARIAEDGGVAKGGEEEEPTLPSSKGNSDMQRIMGMLQQILQIHSSNSPLQAFPVSFPSAPLEGDFPVPPTPQLPYLYLAKFSQCLSCHWGREKRKR